MLAYIMVGTNNLKRSAKFYDAALAPLGLVQTGGDNRYIGYGPKGAPKKSKFYVTKPYNRKPATFGNGTMISLAAKSRRAVDGFHAAALKQVLQKHPGKKEFFVQVQAADGSKVLLRVNGELGVRLTKELVSDLEQLVGAENMMLAGEGQRRMKRIAQQQLFKDAPPIVETALEGPSDEAEMELAGDVL